MKLWQVSNFQRQESEKSFAKGKDVFWKQLRNTFDLKSPAFGW